MSEMTPAASETARIADQLRRVWEGDPWYGANVVEVLRGVTPAQAAHRPIPQAHTIWEIALHMTSWNREVLRRLKTGVSRDPQDGDWPPQPQASPENWRWTTEMLEASLSALIHEVERFPAARLDDTLGEARDRPLGSGVSFYVLLHGIVQHNVAHTAQMSLLKKAVHG
jgi:uncharacterized damage-inducible protein DinB